MEKKKILHSDLKEYLGGLDESILNFTYYSSRHPLAIFNMQSINLNSSFEHFFKILEEKNENIRNIKILREFQYLLNTLFKYFDSFYEILLCCSDIFDDKPEKFIHIWLKNKGYNQGKEFNEKTKDDLEYFRKLYNKLKHSSNILDLLNFHKDEHKIYGYYLQIPYGNGDLGPDNDLHGLMPNGGSCANSFNYDIRRMYYLKFKLEKIFLSCIKKHFEEREIEIVLRKNPYEEKDESEFKVYSKIIKLEEIYFPNELGKPLFRPKWMSNNNKNKIIFTRELIPIIDKLRFGYRVQFISSGDGVSRSYKMPYY